MSHNREGKEREVDRRRSKNWKRLEAVAKISIFFLLHLKIQLKIYIYL